MRPIGDIRRLVLNSFSSVTSDRALTYRDVQRAVVPLGVGADAVRQTVKNMARHGALERVDDVRVPDSSRPLAAYRLAPDGHAHDAQAALCQAVNSWAEFV